MSTDQFLKSQLCSLVWLDMEMTGLDPDKDCVLEVAVILTDDDLNIIDEGLHRVIHQPKSVLDNMDEWCVRVHTENHLIEKVQKSSISVEQAQEDILDLLQKFTKPKKALLCGNSIEQDRRFIVKYMPKLNQFLHYRHINVTSFREMIRRWYPNNLLNAFQKEQSHSALSDIKESIEELKHYKKHFFIQTSREDRFF